MSVERASLKKTLLARKWKITINYSHTEENLAQTPKSKQNWSLSWQRIWSPRASQRPPWSQRWEVTVGWQTFGQRVSCGLGFVTGALLAPLPREERWGGRESVLLLFLCSSLRFLRAHKVPTEATDSQFASGHKEVSRLHCSCFAGCLVRVHTTESNRHATRQNLYLFVSTHLSKFFQPHLAHSEPTQTYRSVHGESVCQYMADLFSPQLF